MACRYPRPHAYDTNGRITGAAQVEDGNISYSYDGAALLGNSFTKDQLIAACSILDAGPTGDIYTITKTTTTGQTYQLYAGKARAVLSQSASVTASFDGSSTTAQNSTAYTYLDNGRLNTATGTSHSTSDDGWGNITTRDTNNDYVVILGQAKVSSAHSTSSTVNCDGSSSLAVSDTAYQYDENGVLSGSGSNGTTSSNDGFGNITTGTSLQSYDIIKGKAKLIASYAVNTAGNLDGSSSQSSSVTSYVYDANGILISADGRIDGSSQDGQGTSTVTVTDQVYDIVCGAARLGTVYRSHRQHARKRIHRVAQLPLLLTVTTLMASSFRSLSEENTTGTDNLNSYVSNAHRDYVIEYGQLRQAHSTTTKTITGSD